MTTLRLDQFTYYCRNAERDSCLDIRQWPLARTSDGDTDSLTQLTGNAERCTNHQPAAKPKNPNGAQPGAWKRSTRNFSPPPHRLRQQVDLDHGKPPAGGCNGVTFSGVSLLSNP